MDSALTPFGPEIWIAEGPVVPFVFGFRYPTRMAVIRLSGGGLFVWSPVALSDALTSDVHALGEVQFLVAPNLLHHLFIGPWMEAYPRARAFAAPGLSRRRKDLRFAGELTDSPEAGWAADIDQVRVGGSFAMTEIVFFHRASRCAIFADLIENLPSDWFRGWRGVLARLDGVTATDPGAPREWRMSFIRRRTARAAIDRILAWPIERVVIAHGEPAATQGAMFVRRAFSWLIERPPGRAGAAPS
jgi:hypothetical protein